MKKSESVPYAEQKWDFIIVGTGMGGSTLGYALAKAGKKVLFLEKGSSQENQDSLRGDFAENFFSQPDLAHAQQRDILMRSGRYFGSVVDVSADRKIQFIPFIGCGAGGSTALYGAALERLFPSDLLPRRNHLPAADSTLPEAWPISYEELIPYYEAAEKLYRVHKASLSPIGSELHRFFLSKGLHPYPLPLACDPDSNCAGCQGFLCARHCKNDSARVCLKPALEEHGACLLDRCEVTNLEAGLDEVKAVHCLYHGQALRLQADVVVLAAGALETPRILFNSKSTSWPQGLANDSGLVGKNLMRHFVDLYILFPKNKPNGNRGSKEIAFNDFYQEQNRKFGTVQSFGVFPPPQMIIAEIKKGLRDHSRAWLTPLLKLARPLLIRFLTKLFSGSVVLASIMEDLPYAENQVMIPEMAQGEEGSRLLISYHLHRYDKNRIASFRKILRKLFRPYRVIRVKQAENNQRLAHVCGTCRFGDDPATSVLNRWNRTHRVKNLYVVDASFFPSSGGTNPGLTIAANALRVADHLTGRSHPSNKTSAVSAEIHTSHD